MCPEDSGSGWGLGSADLWGVIFLPGELIEIEAEPEQVGKTRLQLFRKGIWQGIWCPRPRWSKLSTGVEAQELGSGCTSGSQGTAAAPGGSYYHHQACSHGWQVVRGPGVSSRGWLA